MLKLVREIPRNITDKEVPIEHWVIHYLNLIP